MDLNSCIRTVPDFPKKGVVFRDISTLLLNPEAMEYCVDTFIEKLPSGRIDKVIGIEARGFFLATLLAQRLQVGLVPVRKPGKLPYETVSASYSLEYGEDVLEMHKDAIQKGDRVLIHDDVLATGGTAAATCQLVEELGGTVVQFNFLIEIEELKGRDKIKDYPIEALLVV